MDIVIPFYIYKNLLGYTNGLIHLEIKVKTVNVVD